MGGEAHMPTPDWEATAEVARAEVRRLTAENDALRDALVHASQMQRDAIDRATEAERAVEPMLNSLRVESGRMTAEVAGPIVEHLAMAMACHFRASGAANYIEMGLNAKDPPFERYAVTVQLYGAKSPHMLRAEAETERDRLAADLAAAQAEPRILALRVLTWLYLGDDRSTFPPALLDDLRRAARTGEYRHGE